MSVCVDHVSLSPAQLGLRTVGQLLAHVARQGRRLVVKVLVDGREPDYDDLAALRNVPLDGRSVFVETACPKEMAMEVLDEMSVGMAEADRLTAEAVDLLQRNQTSAAMQKLSGCFTTWHTAKESVEKTAQLLRIDLATVAAGEASLADVLGEFGGQLRQIKTALENRDYVTLGDVLAYETPATTEKWRDAVDAMRGTLAAR